MANNTVEVQTIRDDDRYTTIKITGVANAAWNILGGQTLLQANSLFGANASQNVCPLSLTDVKFSMDVGGLGYIQFYWVSPNTNVALFTFGQIGSATFDGISIQNNANVGSAPGGGDVGVIVSNLAAGNSFNFILTFVKDQTFMYANIPWGVMGWANTMNAYNDPWS